MKKGKCVKTSVQCTIITTEGKHFVGENWCKNPQEVCPRLPGEDYEKCKTICEQEGHAEQVAVRLAGDSARGSRAYLVGHSYACMHCQHALFGAGIKSLSICAPPEKVEELLK